MGSNNAPGMCLLVPGVGAEEVHAKASREIGWGNTTLGDLGVEWQQLDDVVQTALERPELRNTPEPPGARELKDLLEGAFE